MIPSYSIHSLAQFIIQVRDITIEQGEERGKCSFCGHEGSNLRHLTLKKTFTRADFIHDTGYICSNCYHLYHTQEYRKKNWIITRKEFKILERKEIIPALLNLSKEDIPFALYTTNSYKKQGWLRILKTLNYSVNKFLFAWDMELISLDRNTLQEFSDKVRYYRNLNISKTELLEGRIDIKKAGVFLNLPTELSYLKKRKGNPRWNWIVTFSE